MPPGTTNADSVTESAVLPTVGEPTAPKKKKKSRASLAAAGGVETGAPPPKRAKSQKSKPEPIVGGKSGAVSGVDVQPQDLSVLANAAASLLGLGSMPSLPLSVGSPSANGNSAANAASSASQIPQRDVVSTNLPEQVVQKVVPSFSSIKNGVVNNGMNEQRIEVVAAATSSE